jgi:hypothetical protein
MPPRRTTHPDRARARILTVDPETRRIDAGLRDGGVIQVAVIETGPYFRWPRENEIWTLQRRNNTWYLDSLIEDDLLPFSVEEMEPGSAKIQADTVYNEEGKTLGITIRSAEEPENGAEGDLWYNESNNSLNVYSGGNWEPLGVSSGSDSFYTHDQLVASTSWTIDHNLGKFPSITVVDSGGTVGYGDVAYISPNQATVSFPSAFAGKAYCN